MYDGNWRIEVTDELWEFPNQESFNETLKKLLDYKGGYGRDVNKE